MLTACLRSSHLGSSSSGDLVENIHRDTNREQQDALTRYLKMQNYTSPSEMTIHIPTCQSAPTIRPSSTATMRPNHDCSRHTRLTYHTLAVHRTTSFQATHQIAHRDRYTPSLCSDDIYELSMISSSVTRIHKGKCNMASVSSVPGIRTVVYTKSRSRASLMSQ